MRHAYCISFLISSSFLRTLTTIVRYHIIQHAIRAIETGHVYAREKHMRARQQ